MDFKYGDLIVRCGKCGEEQLIEEMVTDGRAIYLFNQVDSYLKLNCPKCDISMEMRMVESKNVDPELLIEEAQIVEEINKTIENEELPQESSTEEIV